MQDFDELTNQIIGAAVELLCALGVLGGKNLANTRNIKTCASGLCGEATTANFPR